MICDIYSPSLAFQGRLHAPNGKAVFRNNNINTYLLETTGLSDLWHNGQPDGHHIVLREDQTGQEVGSGIITSERLSYDNGTLKSEIQASSHLIYAQQMITLPTPSSAPNRQNQSDYYKKTGQAAPLLAELIDTHIGQKAHTSNRTPLIVGSIPNIGKDIKINTRFKVLLEEVQALAEVGGVQIFTEWVEEQGPVLGVREPVDRSVQMRLSADNQGLVSYVLERSAPTETRVLVAGQGEGAARTLELVEGDANSWGFRGLLFQDRRDTDERDMLIQAGEETLTDRVEEASLDLTLQETSSNKFGVDYWIGDILAVELGAGVVVEDTVQTVELEWGPGPTEVKLQIGPVQQESTESKTVKQVNELRKQLQSVQAI